MGINIISEHFVDWGCVCSVMAHVHNSYPAVVDTSATHPPHKIWIWSFHAATPWLDASMSEISSFRPHSSVLVWGELSWAYFLNDQDSRHKNTELYVGLLIPNCHITIKYMQHLWNLAAKDQAECCTDLHWFEVNKSGNCF